MALSQKVEKIAVRPPASRWAIQRKLGPWGLAALLFIGVLIMLYPLAWLITTAITPPAEALTGRFIPAHPTLANFRSILSLASQLPVVRWLENSLFVSAVAAIGVMLVDSLAAFALARLRFVGSRVVFYIVLSSLMVPGIALLIPLYLEFAGANMLDTYWVLILPYTANAFGVFLLYQFFRGIPKDLEEAAIVDGANKFQLWLRVFVPLSGPPTATLGLLTFMNVYNDFFWPLVSTTSVQMRTATVGIFITVTGPNSTNYSLLMALTLISVIPMVIAFLFAQKQLVQGIATTGLKE
jgi:multiple sugar transport system permease protein